MKKKFKVFFKKTFCLFLAMLILTSSFPIQVFAADGFDEYGLSWLFDEDPIIININGEVNEFLNLSKDYFNGIEKFSDSESIQGMAKQIDSIAKKVSSVTPLLTAFQYVSYATSAVNNIIGILQSLGIMKSSEESKYENILKSLDELKKGVEEINTKVTKMQDNLDKNFANLTFGQDQEAARDAQNVWSNFIKNEYGTMTKYMDYYENLVNTESIKLVETWKTNNKTTLRAIYNDSGLLLLSSSNYNGFNKEIPDTPKRSDDTSNSHIDNVVAHEILLPGKYISYNDDVNADNYEEAMRSTIKKGVASAMKTKDIDVNKLSYLGFDNKTSEDKVIDKITDDLLNSVIYEVASLCAESKQDGEVSFAQTVLTAYKQYCGAISGKNDSNSSLYNALKYLTLTYPFHGDVKKYAGSYYSMVGMSIIEFGTFTSTLVASTSSMGKQTKTDLASLTASTLSKTNDIYVSVIKVKDGDKYYDRNDNYCYPLNAEISYVDVSAQTVSWSDTRYRYANATGGRNEWSEKHDDYVDWTIVDSSLKLNTDNIDVYKYEAKRNEDNLTSSMLDSESMQYLYHYIQAASAGRDIREYLKDNKVIKDDKTHSSVLLLPDYKIEKQDLDKSLKVYLYGNDFKKINEYNDDKYVEKYIGLSNGTPIKDGDFKTLVSTKIVGDTFDIEGSVDSVTSSTEASDKITKGVTLGTRIIQFYEGGFATPHYLFHDKANVSVDVSTSATDNRNFYETEAYRSMYTAKVEKNYGMLVKNYSPNNAPKASVNIISKSDFLDFIEEIAEGKDFNNTVIKLSTDIDLKGVEFEDYWPKSLSSREFKGHFNGNGKTISNLTIESSGNRVALFRTTGENAKIENLKLKNVNITGTSESKGAAALVGYANGRLLVDNVEIINGTITGYKYVAGIVGEARENTKVNILNCKNGANITSNNTDAGGIIGNTGNYYVKGAINTGNITAKRGAAGGISGYSGSDSKADSSFVRDSKNTGVITGYDCAGGISGHIASDNRFSRFFNNYNKGDVTVTNKGSAGGIVGYTEAGGAYIDNFNEGIIISNDRYAGGILGENEDDLILIRNNKNEGAVTGVNKTGGIAGYLGDKDYDCIVILESNTNSGIIESTSKDTGDAGGIVGSIYTDNKNHSIKENDNTGQVTAMRQAGGIIGYMTGGGLFDSNSNKATILSKTQNAGGIVGKIEDDKCDFKKSNIYTPRIIIGDNLSATSEKTDYQIKINVDNMHAGKICGWDGYRKNSINSDSLVATIFGEGNLLTIIILLLVLVFGGFAFYKYQNNVKLKRKNNKKGRK